MRVFLKWLGKRKKSQHITYGFWFIVPILNWFYFVYTELLKMEYLIFLVQAPKTSKAAHKAMVLHAHFPHLSTTDHIINSNVTEGSHSVPMTPWAVYIVLCVQFILFYMCNLHCSVYPVYIVLCVLFALFYMYSLCSFVCCLHCSICAIYIVLYVQIIWFCISTLYCSICIVYLVLCMQFILFYICCLHCSVCTIYIVLCI